MKKNPLVSIIVNCHNGEKFLQSCVNSIINQKYKNWELIFWDNCSSDKSNQIIKSYKNKKIKIYKNKIFTSLYKARNLAIKKSSGKYICFLDTDDEMCREKIFKQVKFLEQNKNYKIVYSNFFIKKQNKKNLIKAYRKSFKSGRITKELINDYSIGILTTMLNRSVFKFLKFNNRFNIIGDFDFFIKSSLKYNIAYINEPLAIYRIHNSNFSTKNLNQHISELEYWIKFNSNKFKKKNISLFRPKYNLFNFKIRYFIKNLIK